MRADPDLNTKQPFWETPRNVAILLTVVAAIAGMLGFKLGRERTVQQVQIHLPPGVTLNMSTAFPVPERK